jgi:hypothetical protein
MLQLTAPGGRLGMVMPSGFLADHGCGDLRRHLFERCSIDAVLGFDNRDAVFPIHRGLHFALITLTTGGATRELRARFGLHSAAFLEDVPDAGEIPGSVRVPIDLIERFSGATLAVPELESERDRAILARVLAAAPPLADANGWHGRFGRELNATDDRRHFGVSGLPVLEGKHLQPYAVRVGEATQFIEAERASALLGSRGRIDRPRLGYREVASSTNRLTLIAAVLPAGTATTHTIFCLREPADESFQWYLCGIFNSFIANYIVRLRGGTHLPAATIHRLPVPVIARDSQTFARIGALSRIADTSLEARAEIHARSAMAYGLDLDDFAHVLSSFPLVDAAERKAALAAFRGLEDGI